MRYDDSMRRVNSIFIFLFAAFAFACAPTSVHAQTSRDGIVTVKGARFFLDGRAWVPVGMNVQDASTLWDPSRPVPAESSFTRDFRDISTLGFNSVRLAVKADYFDSVEGFAWLDRRVADAKKRKLKLAIDMHIPTGGAQQDYAPNPSNELFWNSVAMQNRFVETWKTIARRYATSTTVWAYGILNEPSSRDVDQVSILSQRVVDAIRSVDARHVILIQPVQIYDAKWNESFVYPYVSSTNKAYEIHFYRPYGFTMQGAAWGGVDASSTIPSYPMKDGDVASRWNATRVERELGDGWLRAAKRDNVPAVIGEFGTLFTDKPHGQSQWIQDVIRAARKNGIGWTYWIWRTPELKGSFGLHDAKNGKRAEFVSMLSKWARTK